MASSAAPTLQFLGAAGGVTGSKFLFARNSDQVLIDCGLFQGLKELRLKNWAPVPIDLARLRAVVLTHAHIDHSGYLPRIIAKGYRGPIFATPGTCDLLGVMLPDAAHLQEEEARYANQKGYSKHAPALPLYTVEDAELGLRLLRPTKNSETVEVAKGVFADFGRVGHILGAGSVRLSFEVNGQKKYLLDSGDLGRYQTAHSQRSRTGQDRRLAANRVDLRRSIAPPRIGTRAGNHYQRGRRSARLFDNSSICHRPNPRTALHDSQAGG